MDCSPPIFKILHIGEDQPFRFFDLIRLVGTDGEDPDQMIIGIHYRIGVAGQFGRTAIDILAGIHHLEKMDGDSVCATRYI